MALVDMALELGIKSDFLGKGCHVDRFYLFQPSAFAHAGEPQEVTDQFINTLAFSVNAIEHWPGCCRRFSLQLDGDSKSRQRRS